MPDNVQSQEKEYKTCVTVSQIEMGKLLFNWSLNHSLQCPVKWHN